MARAMLLAATLAACLLTISAQVSTKNVTAAAVEDPLPAVKKMNSTANSTGESAQRNEDAAAAMKLASCMNWEVMPRCEAAAGDTGW